MLYKFYFESKKTKTYWLEDAIAFFSDITGLLPE